MRFVLRLCWDRLDLLASLSTDLVGMKEEGTAWSWGTAVNAVFFKKLSVAKVNC